MEYIESETSAGYWPAPLDVQGGGTFLSDLSCVYAADVHDENEAIENTSLPAGVVAGGKMENASNKDRKAHV